MPEERKLVTVLFADIVGSTALASSHDPEVVRRTLSRAFGEMRQVLETYGGTVEKFIGDAVMAVFGIPQTHDDDADRAVRAAFALRDRVAALNASGRFALDLRIGINSGQVVTGGDAETLVTGEPVNAAARLQQAAAPNEILVGALTHQLTEGGARYGAPREIEAKGLGRLAAWPADTLASALPSQHRGMAGLRAPLIGRDDELRLLVDSHRKLTGERRAFLVTVFGNAGVGKSRLVAEFVQAIAADGVRRGRCLPYGEGITFWPVVEILRADAAINALDSHEDATRKLRGAVLSAFAEASDDADAVARRLSVLAGTAKREVAMPDVPAESVQQELRWGLRRYLERRAEHAPLTLVFDDIHWAEPALLDLIEHLAEWSRAPLFLLCLARPDLREVRAGWGGGLMNASAIRLEPLTHPESARLIREILEVDALPEELRDQVIARSEGNPLYVEEFLRMLIDAGHIEHRDGEFVATASLAALVVPATLQGLIAARLDGIPPAVKRTLQRAAVVGKVFWPEAIVAQGHPQGGIEELLLEAARRDLVSELDERGLGGGRAWTFKHILIRDVAYNALPKDERSHAHDAFGRWLEATADARVDEYADIVTYHAEQAFLLAQELGEPDIQALGVRAYGRSLASGTKARRRGDPPAALAFFRRALVVAEAIELSAADRLVTRGLVALVRLALEGSQDALDEIEVVATDLRTFPPTTVLVDLLQAISLQLSDKAPAAAVALDREAVAAARAVGDPESIAWALLRSHWVPWAIGDMAAQRRVLVEAYEYIEASGVESAMGEAVDWLGQNASVRGNFPEAVGYFERAHERAVVGGSPLQRARMLRGPAMAARWRGDHVASLNFARQSVEAAIETGMHSEIGFSYVWVAAALEAAGDLKGTRESYEKSVRELAGSATQAFRAESRACLAKTLVGLGDVAEARRQADTACAEVAPNDAFTLATSAAALGAVCAAEGRVDEAERLYTEALERIGRTGCVSILMEIRREYGAFLIERGRDAEARALLEQVRAFYDSPLVSFERQRTEVLLRRCAEASSSS